MSRRGDPARTARHAAVLLATWVVSGGCATAAPASGGSVRALYEDLDRIVVTRARIGWEVDSNEVEKGSTAALASVCRSTEIARHDLVRWFDAAIAAKGGPVEEAYVRRGRKLRKVRELLKLTRMRMVLERTMERARGSDCAFWLEPREDFAGIHADARRFVLFAESNGGLTFSPEPDGSTTFAGGGSGRLMAGYGLGRVVSVGAGFEIGGQGQFRASDEEAGRRDIKPRFLLGIPLVLRLRKGTFHLSLEGAAAWQFSEADFTLRPGVRVAAVVGTEAVRVRGVMPYIGVGVAVAAFRAADGTARYFFTGVYRVGFDFDPSLF